MPISYPYTQYTGIWKLNAASAAQGAGTWPSPPAPHVFAWGNNSTGQIGIGNTTYYSSPKQVGSLTTWLSMASGSYAAFAIKTDGTLWTWGRNVEGELGLGNTTNYSSPKQIGALTTWATASGGYLHSGAIKTDGTLWMWGANGSGALGLGNTTNYSSPKQVGALTNWLKLSCGQYYTSAIKTDGTLWSWGSNAYGNLGTGNLTYFSSPKQVGALTNWANVFSGPYWTMAIKTDGTLWGWGSNTYGCIGNGNTTSYSSPIQVGALTNWSNVNAGGIYKTYAVKTDGTLWAWGWNRYGNQLPFATATTAYSSPKQVGSLTDWATTPTGLYTYASFVIKTDGTLWCWGRSLSGELGLGNITAYSSPKQVGSLTTWINIATGGINGTTWAIAKT